MTIPECPGCGRPAPPPDGSEADTWRTSTQPLVTICPHCAASPEARERVVTEKLREDWARTTDPADSLILVGGGLKPLVDCTREEIEMHTEHLRRAIEQDDAWRAWLEARIAVLEERGEGML